jgi:hypothetical protein
MAFTAGHVWCMSMCDSPRCINLSLKAAHSTTNYRKNKAFTTVKYVFYDDNHTKKNHTITFKG